MNWLAERSAQRAPCWGKESSTLIFRFSINPECAVDHGGVKRERKNYAIFSLWPFVTSLANFSTTKKNFFFQVTDSKSEEREVVELSINCQSFFPICIINNLVFLFLFQASSDDYTTFFLYIIIIIFWKKIFSQKEKNCNFLTRQHKSSSSSWSPQIHASST